MKALVTGITGFIGSHLAEALIDHGHQVLGLGRTGHWRHDTPAKVQQSAELQCWDLVNPASPDTQRVIIEFAPDVVFHLAAISIPSQCGHQTPTAEAIAVNVDGTAHLLDSLSTLNKLPKLIFTSSSHVYAPVDPANPIVSEDSPLSPQGAYGKTKLRGEELIQARMAENPHLQASIVRGFHHIGPRQPNGLMLTDWLNQLSDPACDSLHVKSTNSFLDLVDVRDAVNAYVLLAAQETPCGVYNLGSGQIFKSGNVLEEIFGILGRSVPVVEATSDARWNAIADVRKLRHLGWQPQRSYSDSIRAMIANNPSTET